MSSNFAVFTKTEFETALAQAIRAIVDARGLAQGEGGVRIKRSESGRGDGREYTYNVFTGNGRIYVKIDSSVSPATGRSRDIGEDAIRVNLIDEFTGRALMKKQAHVKRITTWAQSLSKRLESMFDTAHEHPICFCGAPKVDRSGPNGPFKGCMNFMNHPKKGATSAS